MGQLARLHLDGNVLHVITQDGVRWRILPCPIPSGQRHRLQGVLLAMPTSLFRPLSPCSGGSPAAAAVWSSAGKPVQQRGVTRHEAGGGTPPQ